MTANGATRYFFSGALATDGAHAWFGQHRMAEAIVMAVISFALWMWAVIQPELGKRGAEKT